MEEERGSWKRLIIFSRYRKDTPSLTPRLPMVEVFPNLCETGLTLRLSVFQTLQAVLFQRFVVVSRIGEEQTRLLDLHWKMRLAIMGRLNRFFRPTRFHQEMGPIDKALLHHRLLVLQRLFFIGMRITWN